MFQPHIDITAIYTRQNKSRQAQKTRVWRIDDTKCALTS